MEGLRCQADVASPNERKRALRPRTHYRLLHLVVEDVLGYLEAQRNATERTSIGVKWPPPD